MTSRSVPRLLMSIRTTTTLHPHARTPTSTPRTITSFQGLQSLVQTWKVANTLTFEEEEDTGEETSLHMEALRRWQEEAQKLREMRIHPEDLSHDAANFSSDEMVQNLKQTLEDEELVDIRRGWVATTNY
ncbi:uncharacterized protein [Panulirus ornatus]